MERIRSVKIRSILPIRVLSLTQAHNLQTISSFLHRVQENIMRIAFGGVATESCTFSPLPTRLEDFVVKRGAEMFAQDRYPFFETLPATFLPTLYAYALPGGPVVREAYQQLKAELLERLGRLGAVDGFYLDLHGAMYVSGLDDAEADLAAAIRDLVGPDCLITASMDLHGNVSQQYIEQIDILTAYRTAPHIDTVETRQKACAMLVQCLQEGRRPRQARQPIPVILPGERTSTEVEPAAGLYAALAGVDRVPGILDASIFVGYVWADEPRAGAAVIVTGFDQDVIENEAARLAQQYWNVRRQFTFGVPAGSIDQCLEWALAAPELPVFISDSGDNPTAGGVGDIPIFLERLLAWQPPSAVVASIPDAAAVRACRQAGLGGVVSVSLGGKLDPVHGRPLPVTGSVLHLAKGDPVGGDIAVIQVDKVKVIVTERRKPFHYVAEFEKLGLDPLAHKIVVVKIGYLVPDLKRIAARALLALSPGAVDQAIERLPYHQIHRPIYPLDPDMSWQPTME